jgi:glc operon protein GlcG
MRLESARDAIAAANAKLFQLGLQGISIAIVDAAGNLVAFERATGKPNLTALVCEAKAVTSAVSGVPTSRLAEAEARWPNLTNPLAARLGERFCLYGGGQPIRVGQSVVGAVGVSGGSPELDDTIAAAAAAVAGAAEEAATRAAKSPAPPEFSSPPPVPAAAG